MVPLLVLLGLLQPAPYTPSLSVEVPDGIQEVREGDLASFAVNLRAVGPAHGALRVEFGRAFAPLGWEVHTPGNVSLMPGHARTVHVGVVPRGAVESATVTVPLVGTEEAHEIALVVNVKGLLPAAGTVAVVAGAAAATLLARRK